MTPQLKSAIIGYYRSGATIEEMIGATGLSWEVIHSVINDFKNDDKNNRMLKAGDMV